MSDSSSVLKFTEKLSENLSSAQIADTLDDLIFKALRPILVGSNFIEQYLVEMLPFAASNARRKFSGLTQANLVDSLFSLVVGVDKKQKFKIIKAMQLERTIYFNCLNTFIKLAEEHARLTERFLTTAPNRLALRFRISEQMRRIERLVGMRHGVSMFSVLTKSRYWCNQAFTFKSMVVEKFIRLAFVETMKATRDTTLGIDSDHLFKDLVVSIHRAIDKYNPRKGALTTYVRWWFMDAMTPYKNNHEYNVAYQIPGSKRKQMIADGTLLSNNFAIEIDNDTTESMDDGESSTLEQMIAAENNSLINNIVIRADPFGLACLIHDIEYNLSADELSLLKTTLKTPITSMVKKELATTV